MGGKRWKNMKLPGAPLRILYGKELAWSSKVELQRFSYILGMLKLPFTDWKESKKKKYCLRNNSPVRSFLHTKHQVTNHSGGDCSGGAVKLFICKWRHPILWYCASFRTKLEHMIKTECATYSRSQFQPYKFIFQTDTVCHLTKA